MAIDETAIAYNEVETINGQGEPERTPVMIYSLGFEADDVLAMYAALRSYLKTLAAQDNEELLMIQRVVNLMIELRPSAVKASKSLSLKAVGHSDRP